MTARPPQVRNLGRYALYDRIGTGGMASVFIARHLGPLDFVRTVAVKELHPQFARDPEFVGMFLDEARLAARINHPNVASTLDIISAPGALCLVMEYLHGEDLSRLCQQHARRGSPALDCSLATLIAADALRGLHAAHEAVDDAGKPLELVHRDVSPQNLFACLDGSVRVLDFGVAKATSQSHVTREGQVKGKLAYMAPEQVASQGVDRRTDLFAMGVVLWELLTGQRLFRRDHPGAVVLDVMHGTRKPPSDFAPGIPRALDDAVLRALEARKEDRFSSAAEMASMLEEACRPARREALSEWILELAGVQLRARTERLREIEQLSLTPLRAHRVRADLPSDAQPTLAMQMESSLRGALVELEARRERAESPTRPDALATRSELGQPSAASASLTAADRRSPVPLVIAALLALVAVLLLGVLLRGSVPVTNSDPASGEPPEARGAQQPSTARTGDGDSISAPSAASAATAPRAAVSAAGNVASGEAEAAPRVSSRPPSGAPSKNGCVPDHYYEDGIKRFKPHCLPR